MGCEVVVCTDDASALGSIAQLFAERDRTFSRFIAESELNHVNTLAGSPMLVTPEFASVVALALTAARETDGLVDPTLGGAIEEAGYSADFPDLNDDGHVPAASTAGSWTAVRLVGRALSFPAHVRLDLNAVVKSKTVDDALALMGGDGFVSAGGDLAARGGAVVALPRGGTVRLVRGALATSGTDRRRWQRGGVTQHHLIDARTGAPSRSRWLQVTACGATCVSADIAAKAAFLLDGDGPGWLDEREVPGRFINADGTVHENGAWRLSLSRDPVCT